MTNGSVTVERTPADGAAHQSSVGGSGQERSQISGFAIFLAWLNCWRGSCRARAPRSFGAVIRPSELQTRRDSNVAERSGDISNPEPIGRLPTGRSGRPRGGVEQSETAVSAIMAENWEEISNPVYKAATAARAFARPRGGVARSETAVSGIMAEGMGLTSNLLHF